MTHESEKCCLVLVLVSIIFVYKIEMLITRIIKLIFEGNETAVTFLNGILYMVVLPESNLGKYCNGVRFYTF